MNKSLIKNILLVVVVATAVASLFSSCQRGVGCPYKFEVKTDVKK